MKKLLLSISTVLIVSSNLLAQGGETAGQYMEKVGKEFKEIQAATWDYTKSAANNKSARKINKRRLELIQQIDASTRNVSKLPPFARKTYFKDSVLSFLKMQKIVIAEDYAKIMDLEDIAESSYDAMEAYFKAREIASQKLELSSTRVNEAYKAFAKENNINLIDGEDDKITKQLAVADEVYSHYNEVYLIFFKAYKQESYFLAALNKGDIAGMEQNKSMLETLSMECTEKLKKIKAFRGTDNSILKPALELMNFYKMESSTKFSSLIEYQTKAIAFEKSKKAFEAIKNKTNSDINNYNNLIGEFNNSLNAFNKTNSELNNSRSSLLNNWNKASQNFTAKYL